MTYYGFTQPIFLDAEHSPISKDMTLQYLGEEEAFSLVTTVLYVQTF